MSRAIEIARNGRGTTAPNPSVGAVLVHGRKIIGEGFTSAFGGSHAEVNAIASVVDKTLLRQSTLYVTLEPCSHFGKTPPCADLIVEHKIPQVVVGLLDPHEKVAGRGIERLRRAGAKVSVGILEAECREHHKRFLTFHEKKRPYIILKWAETEDGFIAPEANERHENAQPYWISNSYSRQLTHKWRSEEPAILVGTHTVLADNPKLDVRQWTGKNPKRIVLDATLRIQGNYDILQVASKNSNQSLSLADEGTPTTKRTDHIRAASAPTLILTAIDEVSRYRKGIDYRIIDFSTEVAAQICKILHEENIISVLVEGGAKTLQTFIDANLWDEARIFTGPTRFKKGVKAPVLYGELVASKRIASDSLKIYYHDQEHHF